MNDFQWLLLSIYLQHLWLFIIALSINEYGFGNRSSNAGHKVRKTVIGGIISQLHVGGTCAQKEIV